MSVPSYDLCIKQGNNSSWEFRLKSYDANGNLVPFSLTGSTLSFVAEKADGTKLTGQTTDAVSQSTSDWEITLAFVGNAVAALAGCTGMKVNSTVCPISNSAIYDGDSGLTGMGFDGSAIHLAASTDYTVQLV